MKMDGYESDPSFSFNRVVSIVDAHVKIPQILVYFLPFVVVIKLII